MNFDEILNTIVDIPDYIWYIYALKNDKLSHKILDINIKNVIIESINCGKQAVQFLAKKGINNITQALKYFDVSLKYKNLNSIDKYIFGIFTPPNIITIMSKALEIADITKIDSETINNIIIAHELFHLYENMNKKDIFTQKYKIVVNKYLGIKVQLKIEALSEIAAMSFAKEFLEIDYNPFILNILLVYKFDTNRAIEICDEIIKINNIYRRNQNGNDIKVVW